MTAPYDFDALQDSGIDELPEAQEPESGDRESATDDTRPVEGLAVRPKPKGPLLDAPEGKAVALQVKLWEAQDQAMRRRKVFWDRNHYWLKGYLGVRARSVQSGPQDISTLQFQLYVPLGSLDAPPVMPRAGLLLDRVAAHLLVDPPVPDCEPQTDSDEDTDGVEFANRWLTSDGDETGTNDLSVFRRWVKKGGVFGSAFSYLYVDNRGGGWEPVQVQAHPMAATMDAALVDPQTGALIEDAQSLPMRYVREDGTLTDDPSDEGLKVRWLPAIKERVLDGRSVRFTPDTCEGIEDADAVHILDVLPLGELKTRFEKVAEMSADELTELVQWMPEAARWVIPPYASKKLGNERGSAPGPDGPGNDALVAVLMTYYKAGPLYPKGAVLISAGKKYALYRGEWCATVEGPNGARHVLLDLPVAQCRQLDDDVDGDPYGVGLIEKIGPADEVRGTISAAFLEYVDRFLHPICFVPMGSNIQPEALAARDGTPQQFNPAGLPQWEEVPPFPADAKEMYDRAGIYENDVSGLGETAQGTEVPSVTSGKQAEMVIAQSGINLNNVRTNLGDGIERYWRIKLQLAQAFYTVPMMLRFTGEDGAYKAEEFTQLDLMSARDVRIQRGSFTQLDARAKQMYAEQLLASQVIDPTEFQRLTGGSLRPKLGIQDSPALLRVKRQIAAWKQGPPKGWQPVPPQMDPQTGQEVPSQDPADPFTPGPGDDEQMAASFRHRELFRLVQSTALTKHPREWQALAVAAYQSARQAAGIVTPMEQAEQAQAQAQAQQQAQEQEAATKQQEVALNTRTKETELALKQADLQRETMKDRADAEARAVELATPTGVAL